MLTQLGGNACFRMTVTSLGSNVMLKQSSGNSSCYHRLYYYAQCFDNGNGPGRQGKRGVNPTHIENVEGNWSFPGQFYYDRAGGTVGYILRDGETVAELEATATTAVVEELLIINNTKNVVWDSVNFEFGTWLGASGPKGFIDTQSAYLCAEGEPPANIKVTRSTNVTFAGCTFQHLGGVYALGASKHGAATDLPTHLKACAEDVADLDEAYDSSLTDDASLNLFLASRSGYYLLQRSTSVCMLWRAL